MKITTFCVSFEFEEKTKVNPVQLRGFFATKFNEYVLLHHHTTDGLIYQYPLVQYKVIENNPVVLGIGDGAELLINLFNEYDSIKLGDKSFRIVEKNVTYENQEVGYSDRAIDYSFITPWIALNQENYMKYYLIGGSIERNVLLSRTLIGNILSFSKGIGYSVPGNLICGVYVHPKKISLKKVHLMAFEGYFRVNFLIPNYFGLGKSVSRGFGSVRRIENAISD